MNLARLNETIAELRTLRSAIDPAIEHLERAIAALKALGINAPEIISTFSARSSPEASKTNGYREGSHLDETVKVLEAAKKPLHVKDITRRVSELSGKNVSRASIDGAMSRDIRDSKTPTIMRVSSGVYGLASWRGGPELAQAMIFDQPKTQNRKQFLFDYITQNGPKTRHEIIEGGLMPAGTLANVLNDKTLFTRLPDGRWAVIQQSHAAQ